MFMHIRRRIQPGETDYKYRNLMTAVMTGAVLLAIYLLIMDGTGAGKRQEGILKRNSYGEGSREEELYVSVGESREKEPIKITLEEREYTPEQLREVFDRTVQNMDDWILGKNKSLDSVNTDLNLLTGVPDEPIEIRWELSRYDVMDIQGKLKEDALTEEGTLVELKALLVYVPDEKRTAQYTVNAMLYPHTKDGEEAGAAKVKEKIQNIEKKNRTQETIKLPKNVDGVPVVYRNNMDFRGIWVLAAGCLIAGLLILKEKEEKKAEEQKRRRQMMMDYPEIVDKLTLLLSAGMTVKNAWKKMVMEYGQHTREKRYAYEEMKIALQEMKSGVSEGESYERFGSRCKVQAYLKLGALLSQNLRKGTKGLSELLHIEAVQAFEERKALARRQGEEAGTKLLVPMFLMLGVVLVIVIVPAFLSLQI